MDLHSCCSDIVFAQDPPVVYEAPSPTYLFLPIPPMYPLGERLPTAVRLSKYHTPYLCSCPAEAGVHAIFLALRYTGSLPQSLALLTRPGANL